MKNFEVSKRVLRLHTLMKAATSSTLDVELQSHWARYICVLVAGLLENALIELYSEHVTRASSGPTANYARSRLATIQNPKAVKFVDLARSFDPIWAKELENFMADDGRKDAIDSIMNLRHQIAHGKDAGITYVQIRLYLEKALEVVEFIEKQLRP